MADHVLVNQPTGAPTRKVAGATLAAAVSVIGIWGIETGFGIDLPTAVEGAIVVVLTFFGGYLPKNALPSE